MIFPKLNNKSFGYVNLNLESKDWYKEMALDPNSENILINPIKCQEFIDDIHKKYSLDFSYGGWMEDRTFLWRGWYMEKENIFTHLGIDLNVPEGTEIATDFEAVVVKIDNDYPTDGGWGPYVILKHLIEPVYIIFAHLDICIQCKIGDKLEVGTIFSKVGKPPLNGNWFAHVHVQTIEEQYYLEIKKNNEWGKFDGYGLKSEIEINAIRYKDPMEFISLS